MQSTEENIPGANTEGCGCLPQSSSHGGYHGRQGFACIKHVSEGRLDAGKHAFALIGLHKIRHSTLGILEPWH